MALMFDALAQAKITSPLHNNYSQHFLHPFSHALFRKKGKWETAPSPVQGRIKNNLAIPTRNEIVDWYKDYISNKSYIRR
jgi:hypothetical protein